mgnify:CR=1 FL=1
MLKKVRELLVAGLLSLTLGVGLAAVVIVAMLAVWYTLGKTASILAFAAACLGLVVLVLRSGKPKDD